MVTDKTRNPAMMGAQATAPPITPYRDALRVFERTYLEALLAASGGNKGRAARLARIGRPQLYRMLVRHGLHVTTSRWLQGAGERA